MLKRFHELRSAAGLTVSEAGEFLGIDLAKIDAYEDGRLALRPRDVQVLKGLAKVGRTDFESARRAPVNTPRLDNLPEVCLRDTREQYGELVEKIGLTSEIGQRILKKLSRLSTDNCREIEPWFALWHEHCDRYFDLRAADEFLSGYVAAASGARLFIAHTYCKIVLSELIQLASSNPLKSGARRRSLYDWIDYIGDQELMILRAELSSCARQTADFSSFTAVRCSDLLAAVYQEILPSNLRHLLGEYYTPPWLVEYCISHAGKHQPNPDQVLTIMDPAAGSGSFLAHYIARLSIVGSTSAAKIVGFDINPLAVDFCHANVSLVMSKLNILTETISCELAIHLTDFVVDPTFDALGPLFSANKGGRRKILGVDFSDEVNSATALSDAMRPFQLSPKAYRAFVATLKQYVSEISIATKRIGAHIIVGNPPWITWDGLTRGYREKVAPQWASSTLVTNTGWRAKVSAGKTDFSSLFVYRAAQRHAAPNAAMVFVVPLSLFQSRLAGAGFRTFRTADGRSFAPVQIDDFSNVKVFPDAVNRTSVGVFLVDRNPSYPISYKTWRTDRTGGGRLTCLSALGGPLDPSENNSPVIAFDPGCTDLKTFVGKSDYRARGGVNTGGANTIFWLDLLARKEKFCRIRNVGKSRRSNSPVMVADVEKDAVHPLLCGTDMRRWKAVPGKSILLLYSAEQPKKALPVSVVRERFPKAYEYVSRFRFELESRKEYHRWGCSGPFYEVYRIGPYTFSPIKVVWQHTGYRNSLNVSVIDDRQRQVTIPDQKVILIPFQELEEAHYVCAFLSSSVTAKLLDRYLGTDASTHILDYVALRRFLARSKEHRRLAELSLLAHSAAAQGREVTEAEQEIDGIVASLLAK